MTLSLECFEIRVVIILLLILLQLLNSLLINSVSKVMYDYLLDTIWWERLLLRLRLSSSSTVIWLLLLLLQIDIAID